MEQNSDRPIKMTEVCLRDGSHVVAHQFTREQVQAVARGLDEAGVPYIEVSHGDGLGGSTIQYGRSLVDEMELIEAAVASCRQAKVAALLIPGIGTVHELKEAQKRGAGLVRVATHVTEADVSAQERATRRQRC